MNSAWVLIMVLLGTDVGGVSTAEFTSLKSCEKAGKTFVQMGSVSGKTSIALFDYRCVEKDIPIKKQQ